MAFLRLNGVELGIDEGSWPETPAYIHGGVSRVYNGGARASSAREKRLWVGSTTPLTPDAAAFLEALLKRQGHGWNFDADTYCGKGVGPSSGTYTQSGSGGYVTGHLGVGSGDSVSFDLSAYGAWDAWTVLVWQDDGGGYAHFAETSESNSEYKNGAATSGACPFISESSGVFTLAGEDEDGVNAAVDYDELFIFPAVMTADQISDWYTNHTGIAYGKPPVLRASGDFVRETSVDVIPNLTSVDFVQRRIGGTWYDNARILNFELYEK